MTTLLRQLVLVKVPFAGRAKAGPVGMKTQERKVEPVW
jgi:hypothetical protein